MINSNPDLNTKVKKLIKEESNYQIISDSNTTESDEETSLQYIESPSRDSKGKDRVQVLHKVFGFAILTTLMTEIVSIIILPLCIFTLTKDGKICTKKERLRKEGKRLRSSVPLVAMKRMYAQSISDKEESQGDGKEENEGDNRRDVSRDDHDEAERGGKGEERGGGEEGVEGEGEAEQGGGEAEQGGGGGGGEEGEAEQGGGEGAAEQGGGEGGGGEGGGGGEEEGGEEEEDDKKEDKEQEDDNEENEEDNDKRNAKKTLPNTCAKSKGDCETVKEHPLLTNESVTTEQWDDADLTVPDTMNENEEKKPCDESKGGDCEIMKEKTNESVTTEQFIGAENGRKEKKRIKTRKIKRKGKRYTTSDDCSKLKPFAQLSEMEKRAFLLNDHFVQTITSDNDRTKAAEKWIAMKRRQEYPQEGPRDDENLELEELLESLSNDELAEFLAESKAKISCQKTKLVTKQGKSTHLIRNQSSNKRPAKEPLENRSTKRCSKHLVLREIVHQKRNQDSILRRCFLMNVAQVICLHSMGKESYKKRTWKWREESH